MSSERIPRPAVAVLVAIFVSACAAAPSTTSGAATQTPASASPGLSEPETPVPSDSAPQSSPSPSASASTGLVDLLPATVGGAVLTRELVELETFNPDPNSDLGRLLAGIGKTKADLELASAYDASGNLALEITLLRFAGVDEASLAPAARSAFAPRDGRTIEIVDLGGHEVLAITDAGDELGTAYVLVSGDVVYSVHSPDRALATEAITSLPALAGGG